MEDATARPVMPIVMSVSTRSPNSMLSLTSRTSNKCSMYVFVIIYIEMSQLFWMSKMDSGSDQSKAICNAHAGGYHDLRKETRLRWLASRGKQALTTFAEFRTPCNAACKHRFSL